MPIGKLHEFDLAGGKHWPAYVRLVKQYILLNEIKDDLHVATLVTHVGAATYQLMCDLCAPANPEDKTFGALVELVTNHLEPKRSEIAERYTFRQRCQVEGESIGTFLQNLKHLATYCNFGANLEENLRDQFVAGLRSEEIRSRLFTVCALDYKKAVELALSLEAAERHAAEAAGRRAALSGSAAGAGLGQGEAADGLHRVGAGLGAPSGGRRRRGNACWRCGKGAHSPNKCRYKSYMCDKCSEKGHLSVMCPKDKEVEAEQDDATYLHFVENSFPLSYRDIDRETKKDPTLCKIYGYILSGWPNDLEIEGEKSYYYRKDNLYVDHGCIVYGYRVVVPVSLRTAVLQEIHAGHMGVVRMKQIARNYVWWPQIDSQIEELARGCAACTAVRDAPPRAPPVPYVWPSEPWTRLHVDFLQHGGKYYLVIIDSHSKWIEVFPMNSGTSASQVNTRLRECFARFGLPKQLVSDGGPPFTSEEFENFLRHNGVKHILTAPYHPSSNGAAENAVKTIKKTIKKAKLEGEDIDRALCKFLFQYRNSAHTTTEKEPAVALLGHRLRSRLDMLRCSTADRVSAAQSAQVQHAGGTARGVHVGDQVLMRDFSKNSQGKWKSGVITERTGAVTYKVQSDGISSHRHVDQIIPSRKSHRFSDVYESSHEPHDSTSSEGMLPTASCEGAGMAEPLPNASRQSLSDIDIGKESGPLPFSPTSYKSRLRPRTDKM